MKNVLFLVTALILSLNLSANTLLNGDFEQQGDGWVLDKHLMHIENYSDSTAETGNYVLLAKTIRSRILEASHPLLLSKYAYEVRITLDLKLSKGYTTAGGGSGIILYARIKLDDHFVGDAIRLSKGDDTKGWMRKEIIIKELGVWSNTSTLILQLGRAKGKVFIDNIVVTYM